MTTYNSVVCRVGIRFPTPDVAGLLCSYKGVQEILSCHFASLPALNVATDAEWTSTSLPFIWNIIWIHLLIYIGRSNKFPASFTMSSSQIGLCKWFISTLYCKIIPSKLLATFVIVLNFGNLRSLMEHSHSFYVTIMLSFALILCLPDTCHVQYSLNKADFDSVFVVLICAKCNLPWLYL